MLDTMTLTKAVGALCGALLVFLLGGWLGQSLFTIGGGHGDHHAQAYLIDMGEEDGPATEEEQVDFAALVASADSGNGAGVFRKCSACHKVDGSDGTGPHLNGVVGRPIGSVEGFAYSEVLAGMTADTWTPEHLSAFVENPKGWAKGTKMSFAGLKKVGDRADLVAYLIGESPDYVFEGPVDAPAEAAEGGDAPAEPATDEAAPSAH